MIGVCCDGKLVGLDVVFETDDRETIMFQALRVHPDCRGKGAGTFLSHAVTAHVNTHCKSTAKRLRVTVNGDNATSLALHERQGFVRQFSLGLTYAMMPAPDALTALEQHKQHNPYAGRLFEATPKCVVERLANSTLVPKNTLISDWVAYDVRLSNLQVMSSNHTFILSDNSDNSTNTTTPSGFSFSAPSPRACGQSTYATIYLRDPSDTNTLLAHAHAHFRLALATPGCQRLYFITPEPLIARLESFLTTVSTVRGGTPPFTYEQMWLMEKDISNGSL